jgi:anti-anti-sigma regulatory factor
VWERSGRIEEAGVQYANDTPHVHFAVIGDRRNGVERLSLIGSLDRSTVAILEREVDDVSHANGAIVLDLHNLDAVEVDAVRALQAMAQRAADGGWFLFIVHSSEPVREAFERDGAADLLCADVSDILSSGDGDWAPITLPPLPGQRMNTTRLRLVEIQP